MFNNKEKMMEVNENIKNLKNRLDSLWSDCFERNHNRINEIKSLEHDVKKLIKLTEDNRTAKCSICGKKDFVDNMSSLDRDQALKLGFVDHNSFAFLSESYTCHVHADCAKIKRSDDGKGWDKIKINTPENNTKKSK